MLYIIHKNKKKSNFKNFFTNKTQKFLTFWCFSYIIKYLIILVIVFYRMENSEIKHETKENENKTSTSGVDYNENLKRINKYKEKSEAIKKEDEEEAEFLLIDDISKEQYDDLRVKNQLTDDEVRKVVKYSNNTNNGVVLFLTSISVEQAKILSKVNKFVVFRNLENISDDEAEELSKQWEFLWLSWLKGITDSQAKSFAKVKTLDLRWLKSITDSQARELSNLENNLYLNEDILTSIQKTILTRYGYDLQD